ncbi:SDR family oxidoreductase [Risungbinella massiliensis]|uniref:SDR family oxidoreductase n=1 Tax=Risungbinella massiliensis TaxID=1329796 RepID=UPI0005CC5E58|nr:SDR family oxidoreductase [Risungbinella massiliensis]
MKNVWIVGATSDVALSTAEILAAKGYNLILGGRRMDTLTAKATELAQKYPIQAVAQPFDGLDYASHKESVEKAVATFGSLDGVIVAHGYLGDQKKGEQDWEEAERILHTNFTSKVSVLNHVANYMEKQKAGWICAITSVAGDRGRQSNFLYGSSKGAASLYLQGLRNRLAKSGVHVVTVKPGFIATKMTKDLDLKGPLVATPEQVAKVMVSAIEGKKNVVYAPWFWRGIMRVVKTIPEFIFKKMSM